MKIFKQYTELLDNKRKQSLEASCPDLHKLLGWDSE